MVLVNQDQIGNFVQLWQKKIIQIDKRILLPRLLTYLLSKCTNYLALDSELLFSNVVRIMTFVEHA